MENIKLQVSSSLIYFYLKLNWLMNNLNEIKWVSINFIWKDSFHIFGGVVMLSLVLVYFNYVITPVLYVIINNEFILNALIFKNRHY